MLEPEKCCYLNKEVKQLSLLLPKITPSQPMIRSHMQTLRFRIVFCCFPVYQAKTESSPGENHHILKSLTQTIQNSAPSHLYEYEMIFLVSHVNDGSELL